MLIAVAYDVRDDKRRTKLSDALQNYGKHVQLSVFECLLEEPQVERMPRAVERIIASEENTVRWHHERELAGHSTVGRQRPDSRSTTAGREVRSAEQLYSRAASNSWSAASAFSGGYRWVNCSNLARCAPRSAAVTVGVSE